MKSIAIKRHDDEKWALHVSSKGLHLKDQSPSLKKLTTPSSPHEGAIMGQFPESSAVAAIEGGFKIHTMNLQSKPVH